MLNSKIIKGFKMLCIGLALSLGVMGEAISAETITKTFMKMEGVDSPIKLQGWQGSYTVKIPLSAREAFTGGKIHLETVNSRSLIKDRSAMTVRLNGHILLQYDLDPKDTKNVHDFSLPKEFLKVGYNDLNFEAVQHYAYECEDPGSPELWTDIDAQRSTISMDFAGFIGNGLPKLTQLSTMFDKKGWLNRQVSFVSGSDVFNPLETKASLEVAEGIGLFYKFRPIKFMSYTGQSAVSLKDIGGIAPNLNPLLGQTGDVVLIGKKATISRYLSPEIAQLIVSSFVGVYPINDGKSVLLIVSGTNDEEVDKAARSIMDINYPFPDSSASLIKDVPNPAKPLFINEDKETNLSDIGFTTSMARGWAGQKINFDFRTPAGFTADKGDVAKISLHFSYGAGLRKDSSLIIKLNGNFATSVPLNEENGAEFEHLKLEVPANFIKAGYNRITFEPVFVPHKNKCELFREDGMILTVYDDSTLTLPSSSSSPKAPDLNRFANSFWSQDNLFRIFLTNQSTANVNTALNFMGVVAQKNRNAIEVEASFQPFEKGDMTIIGDTSGLPDDITNKLKLKTNNWSAQGNGVAFIQLGLQDRVITGLIGSDPNVSQKALQQLQENYWWDNFEGEAFIINTEMSSFSVEKARDTVSYGESYKASNYVPKFLPKNTSWLIPLVVVLAFIFVLSFIARIKRLKRVKEVENHDEEDEE